MKKNITELKSVGCGIDENGMVYTQYHNGEYDMDSGTHLLDIDNPDWFRGLDTKDEETINQYVGDETDFWKVK